MKNYLLLLGLIAAGVSPLLADNADPPVAAVRIERFRCEFDKGSRPRDGVNRFNVHESSQAAVFDVRFAGTIGEATLTRHETLWPEQIDLRVTGQAQGFIMVDLMTDNGVSFCEVVDTKKHISYYSANGNHRPGPRDSAYRIESVRERDVARLLIVTPPAARLNAHWKIHWYAAGW